MTTLTQLKSEVAANEDIAELFDVLKNIAIAEYYRWQQHHDFFDQFNDSIKGFFDLLKLGNAQHPLIEKGAGANGVLVMTSDDGFTGGLNDRVIERARGIKNDGSTVWLVVGQRGQRIVESMGRTPIEAPSFNSASPDKSVQALKKVLIDTYIEKDLSSLTLIYPRPRSFSLQVVETLPLLPCAQIIELKSNVKSADKVILESSPEKILDQLIQRWLDVTLLQIYEMSKLSEYASRSLQLEQSTQVLEEHSKDLRFSFVRARRQHLDKEMREAFTAQLVRQKR